jgi:hypothetical protein
MADYVVTRAATTSLTPSTTAATAGIIKIDLGGTLCSPNLYYWAIGPAANSADNTYAVRLKRQTTAGTWTNSQTPAPKDKHSGAALTTAATVSSAAGTASDILGEWGYHMRGGYAYQVNPGGEWEVLLAAAAGIILEYSFAQGTDVQNPTFFFRE